MQAITPFLWYDGKAEEAIKLYTSVFPNSKILSIEYWGAGTPFPANQVKTGTFILNGVQFYAFDAGPQFKFTEAISFYIDCDTQEDVDHYWNKLTADGGAESMCGWLKDKFGISWQVVPKALPQLLNDKRPGVAQKAMQAMMKMKKIVIADLEKAVGD